MHLIYKYILIALTLVISVFYLFFSYYAEPQYIQFMKFIPTYNSSRIFGLKFNYVISNNCTNDDAIRAIQIVTSFAGNVEARSALRRAYPQRELREIGIYRVFLLAMLKPGVSEVTENAILNENDRYNDIIQGNFLEDYRNLTYKHIMGIRWAVMECEAPLIIKMDDDIVVDMYSLMQIIDSKKDMPFDFLGYLLNDMRPIRLKANKWYVSEEEYMKNSYPPFVSGWLYVLKNKAAEEILQALDSEKYFWIDDVFVTGVLAEKVNLTHRDMKEYFTTNPEYFECCMRDKVKCGFIVGPSGGDYSINIDFQRHSKICQIRNCTEYTNGKTFRNSCVVSRKLPSIGKGFAKLDLVKL